MAKRLCIMFILVLWMLILLAPMCLAGDGMFPDPQDLGIQSSQKKTFDDYYLENYVFDIKPQPLADKPVELVTTLASVVFQLHTYLCKGVVSILMGAFNVDLFTMFGDLIDNVIGMVEKSVFEPMIWIALPITAIFAFINMAIHRINTASRLIFSTIAVLVVAFIFMKSPSTVLVKLNELANEASGSILAGSASVITGQKVTGDDAIINLGNIYWNTMVDKPWELIEFGYMGAPQADIETFLDNTPGSDERVKLAKEWADDDFAQFDKGGQGTRLAMSFLFLLILLVINIALVILAALMIVFQAAALFCAIVGMIVIALALLPNVGFAPIEKWFMKLLGYITYKVAVTLLICTYFAINMGLYSAIPKYGWFFVMGLQAIVIIAIIYFRNDIFSVITNIQNAGARLSNRLEQQESKVFKQKALKAVATGYAVDRLASRVGEIRQHRIAQKEEKQYRPMANEYLTQKYNNEKKAAEDRARREGREVTSQDYSPFVRATDSRIEKGFNPFSESEIKSTVQYMSSLKKEGNDPRRLMSVSPEGRNAAEIRYDQKTLNQQTQQTRRELRSRALQNNTKLMLNTSPGPKLPTGIADFMAGERAARHDNPISQSEPSGAKEAAAAENNNASRAQAAATTENNNVDVPEEFRGQFTANQSGGRVRYTMNRDYIRNMARQSVAVASDSGQTNNTNSTTNTTVGTGDDLQKKYQATRKGNKIQLSQSGSKPYENVISKGPENPKEVHISGSGTASSQQINLEKTDNQKMIQHVTDREENQINITHRGEKVIEIHRNTEVSNTVVEQDKRTERVIQKETRNENTHVQTQNNWKQDHNPERQRENVTGGVNPDRRKQRLEKLAEKVAKPQTGDKMESPKDE